MAPPRQPQDGKDYLLQTAQALAILGPREAGGAGVITRDEARRALKERHGLDLATSDELAAAPRHPAFQEFLAKLTPEEIAELELAIADERHAIETWTPAMTKVPVPDGGLADLSDEPPEDEEQ
jgi:hypothetical protein